MAEINKVKQELEKAELKFSGKKVLDEIARVEGGPRPDSARERPGSAVEQAKERGPMAGTKPDKEEKEGEKAAISSLPISGDEQKVREKKIENIMEDGLADIFLNLEPNKQNEFKIKGEQTANEINELLNKVKVKANKIIDLIKKWLSLIPGVNRFFIEQEAKIKTDKIMRLNMNKWP